MSTRVENFWSHVGNGTPVGCWPWLGWRDALGYGRYGGDGAHRVAFRLAGNDLPDGLTIDHLCRNPSCVRPDHMEAVTMKVNTLRGTSPAANHALQTHCENGHPFDEANTYLHTRKGRVERHCRACNRRSVAARKARRLASGELRSRTHRINDVP